MDAQAFFKMDVFFVVTTVAVCVIGILLSALLFQAYKIFKNVERISRIVVEEVELLHEDIGEARRSIKRDGSYVRHLFRLFSKRFQASSRKNPP